MKLSIVMPVYNERGTLAAIVAKVEAATSGMERELIIVDDCSNDGTADVLDDICRRYSFVKRHAHERNYGKGAALRTGFSLVSGDVIVIQDADLEYDPLDYGRLLQPVLDGHADVVFGSRFLDGGPHRVVYFWHYVGNRLITLLSDMMTNLNLTDIEVCYKVFRREVLNGLKLTENRFGFEVEITAKVARGGWRIYEVPVSYYGRSYAEGKKITWRDGIRALWCIIKHRFV